MEPVRQKFDQWSIVELFGHQKIAGHCTEENLFGTNMLRVDVPETKDQPPFTKYFGGSAIYAINPVDEATATYYAKTLGIAPITVWQVDQFISKLNENKKELPAADGPHDIDMDRGEWDDEN